MYTVKTPRAFIYRLSEKGEKAEITDELLSGWEVEIMGEEKNGFVPCRSFYGYEGYAEKETLVHGTVPGEKLIVVSGFADVVTSPDLKAVKLVTLPEGSLVVKSSDVNDDYVGVMTSGGVNGYMRKKQCASYAGCKYPSGASSSPPPSGDEFREKIVKNALGYLGSPYRWGGKTREGIDCSGLCFMSYFMSGVIIYRDAVYETPYTRRIPFEKLKKADLIYFPGHVAMYLGDGKFIHSNARHFCVSVDSFEKSPGNDYGASLFERIKGCASVFSDEENR